MSKWHSKRLWSPHAADPPLLCWLQLLSYRWNYPQWTDDVYRRHCNRHNWPVDTCQSRRVCCTGSVCYRWRGIWRHWSWPANYWYPDCIPSFRRYLCLWRSHSRPLPDTRSAHYLPSFWQCRSVRSRHKLLKVGLEEDEKWNSYLSGWFCIDRDSMNLFNPFMRVTN